jgi:hypothetical protein
LFRKAADFAAFVRVLDEASKDTPLRLLALSIMPAQWHFVVWQDTDCQLTAFHRWLTLTHSVRWQAHYHRTGSGHVYQNRFKSKPSQYRKRPPWHGAALHRAQSTATGFGAARRGLALAEPELLAGGDALLRLHAMAANWLNWVSAPQRRKGGRISAVAPHFWSVSQGAVREAAA